MGESLQKFISVIESQSVQVISDEINRLLDDEVRDPRSLNAEKQQQIETIFEAMKEFASDGPPEARDKVRNILESNPIISSQVLRLMDSSILTQALNAGFVSGAFESMLSNMTPSLNFNVPVENSQSILAEQNPLYLALDARSFATISGAYAATGMQETFSSEVALPLLAMNPYDNPDGFDKFTGFYPVFSEHNKEASLFIETTVEEALRNEDPRFSSFMLEQFQRGDPLMQGAADHMSGAFTIAFEQDNINMLEKTIGFYNETASQLQEVGDFAPLFMPWGNDKISFVSYAKPEMIAVILNSLDKLVTPEAKDEILEVLQTGVYQNRHGMDLVEAASQIARGETLGVSMEIAPTEEILKPPSVAVSPPIRP